MKNLLTTIINHFPTNQATKDLVHSNYLGWVIDGLNLPINDFLSFANNQHSADLNSTYDYYVSKGILFTDVVSLLEMLESVTIDMRDLYKVTITDDVCGKATVYCQGMNDVKDFVFGIFTDWDREEDTIDEIDEHIRENGVGSVTVEKIHLLCTKGE